ncbi:hypothetical protein PVAG01_06932 [Phlyctema vagabunda]|uniref:DUF2264 domain-containing protein n=1 Tax=Phlyctema vagabunda TaxID=108571 RepID=A0ABR4PHG2_9HELO
MPPLPGFSDNLFKTRDDCVKATEVILSALEPYKSSKGARISLPVESGTHFDEVAAQLEGFARPLWGVGALLAQGQANEDLKSYALGLAAGTNPDNEQGPNGEYWGDIKDMDQRMVEMEIVSYAVLTAPEAFLPPLPQDFACPTSEELSNIESRQKIIAYLRSINDKQMPLTNWLWFRVMTNLALVKSCGIPYNELKSSMNADLDTLDTFYMGNGWASDGPWTDQGRQADYYSGSFAIHFSQLLYAKFAEDIDPNRCSIFKTRARDFASNFWRYFDENGAAIPFGRSLTYRFAFAGFWSALALADVSLPDSLSLGHVKGLLLRHLRWWSKKHGIFYQDGTLTIGFCYPNMYMSEDYNSPQSPYWCLKTLCVISLPEEHEFWTCEELPYPQALNRDPIIGVLENPSQILIHSPYHHFLLSSGQFCPWPLKATEAKYCKFAYSSSFGFSIPTGELIQQKAPDNALHISNDAGESWKCRWKSKKPIWASADLYGRGEIEERLTTVISQWTPGSSIPLNVQTTLIPPSKHWPDWHVRIHRIRSSAQLNKVSFVEGGFAISGRNKLGLAVPFKDLASNKDQVKADSSLECQFEETEASIICSESGMSGIAQLHPGQGKGIILKPDANTNLMCPRTLIPTLQQSHDLQNEQELVFVVGVFAVSNSYAVPSAPELLNRWLDRPIIRFRGDDNSFSEPEFAIYV